MIDATRKRSYVLLATFLAVLGQSWWSSLAFGQVPKKAARTDRLASVHWLADYDAWHSTIGEEWLAKRVAKLVWYEGPHFTRELIRQNVALRLHVKWSSKPPDVVDDPERVKRWVSKVVDNCIIDTWNQSRERFATIPIDDVAREAGWLGVVSEQTIADARAKLPDEELERKEFATMLPAALASLSPEERYVIQLRVSGNPLRTIAHRTGTSKSTAHRTYKSALQKLRIGPLSVFDPRADRPTNPRRFSLAGQAQRNAIQDRTEPAPAPASDYDKMVKPFDRSPTYDLGSHSTPPLNERHYPAALGSARPKRASPARSAGAAGAGAILMSLLERKRRRRRGGAQESMCPPPVRPFVPPMAGRQPRELLGPPGRGQFVIRL